MKVNRERILREKKEAGATAMKTAKPVLPTIALGSAILSWRKRKEMEGETQWGK